MKAVIYYIIIAALFFQVGRGTMLGAVNRCQNRVAESSKTIDSCIATSTRWMEQSRMSQSLAEKAIKGHQRCNVVLENAVKTMTGLGLESVDTD